MEPVHRRRYSAEDLSKLIRTLKFSEGFKLDKTQKHASIRSNLIKEAYEVLEAIDMQDSELLKEELGDILLQIMQHSSIEEEEGNFSFDDVVNSACEKILAKYPHLAIEKSAESNVYSMPQRGFNLPRMRSFGQNDQTEKTVMPALIEARKIQERAARLNFGVFSVGEAFNEAFERLHYLETLILGRRKEFYEKEFGDLIFSVSEIARLLGIDAETALHNSSEIFKNEFLCKLSLANRNNL